MSEDRPETPPAGGSGSSGGSGRKAYFFKCASGTAQAESGTLGLGGRVTVEVKRKEGGTPAQGQRTAVIIPSGRRIESLTDGTGKAEVSGLPESGCKAEVVGASGVEREGQGPVSGPVDVANGQTVTFLIARPAAPSGGGGGGGGGGALPAGENPSFADTPADNPVARKFQKLVDCIKAFSYPDCTVRGCVYGSNTPFYVPEGNTLLNRSNRNEGNEAGTAWRAPSHLFMCSGLGSFVRGFWLHINGARTPGGKKLLVEMAGGRAGHRIYAGGRRPSGFVPELAEYHSPVFPSADGSERKVSMAQILENDRWRTDLGELNVWFMYHHVAMFVKLGNGSRIRGIINRQTGQPYEDGLYHFHAGGSMTGWQRNSWQPTTFTRCDNVARYRNNTRCDNDNGGHLYMVKPLTADAKPDGGPWASNPEPRLGFTFWSGPRSRQTLYPIDGGGGGGS